MCLNVDTNLHKDVYKPKIAKEDIVCYKALAMAYNSLTHINYYSSPFYSTAPWEKGKTYEAVEIWPRCTPVVEDGYFHTFIFIDDAEHLKLDLSTRYEMVVAKCIIPEGSEYYVGVDNSNKPSYASKLLKIEEIILK